MTKLTAAEHITLKIAAIDIISAAVAGDHQAAFDIMARRHAQGYMLCLAVATMSSRNLISDELWKRRADLLETLELELEDEQLSEETGP